MLPTDGSEPSMEAFEYAVDLAKWYGATLRTSPTRTATASRPSSMPVLAVNSGE
ncbi:universal stress protein [Haloarchaeobius salinus]|uniref:universal stress protein n=1 Tax=Haloarchaeobius salinus TaxID=1198298 RepID=UPI00210E9521